MSEIENEFKLAHEVFDTCMKEFGQDWVKMLSFSSYLSALIIYGGMTLQKVDDWEKEEELSISGLLIGVKKRLKEIKQVQDEERIL